MLLHRLRTPAGRTRTRTTQRLLPALVNRLALVAPAAAPNLVSPRNLSLVSSAVRVAMSIAPPPTVERLPATPEGIVRQYHEGLPIPLTVTQAEQLEHFARSLRIERPQFSLLLTRVAVRVPARHVESVLRAKELASHVYFPPRLPAVWPDPQDTKAGRVVALKYQSLADVPREVQDYVAAKHLELTVATRQVGYDYFTADEVMSAIFPASLAAKGTPGAFASTGHIAHMNLREAWVPYKYVIGQVLVDKNKGIQTVVNKLDAIDTRFRTFAMELLAGEPKYEVTLTEHSCSFTFDFRHVYWNSRLESEHARLVHLFGTGAVVVDAMAGVGPFAIPAARVNKCQVWANDLNPASYESLVYNARANHVASQIHASCEDAYTYIPRVVEQIWDNAPLRGVILASAHDMRKAQTELKQVGQERREKALAQGLTNAPMPTAEEEAANPINRLPHGRPRRYPEHFVMNLPSTALDFLGAFRGAFRSLTSSPGRRAEFERDVEARSQDPLSNGVAWPLVHVYCFTKDMEHPAEDLIRRANAALGLPEGSEHALLVPKEILTVPNKEPKGRQSGAAPQAARPPASGTGTQKWNPLSPGRPKATLTYVRTVSPNKDMYCLTFPLGPHVLLDLDPVPLPGADVPSAPSTSDLPPVDTVRRPRPSDLPVQDPKASTPPAWSYWETPGSPEQA